VWAVPVAVLVITFVLDAPGMYPTMILGSDFKEAFHYYFGGGFHFPEYSNYGELLRHLSGNFDIIRGYTQLRVAVPAYVGVAYSIGAWGSLCLKKLHTNGTEPKEAVSRNA
jgi:hypothetical protein